MLQYLSAFPISPQKSTNEDYIRMGSEMNTILDTESLKRLHAALMKAFYRVAVLNGEFPVVLQDHITQATVNISLRSQHCKALIANSELFAQMHRCLNHPNLHHVIHMAFPNSPPCPPWWNNDIDICLMRAFSKYGFINWRNAVQDPAFQHHLARVLNEMIQEGFIIDRLRSVSAHLSALLNQPPPRPVGTHPPSMSENQSFPPHSTRTSMSDDDVIALESPPFKHQTPPVPTNLKPENVMRKVAQEPPLKPKTGGLIPPLNKKPVLKQSNVAQYFVPTNNATSVQQPASNPM
jgi:hypothetical protein